MTAEAVGQLGLGVIGRLYAGHLVRKHGNVVVYDIAPERMQEIVALGATAATSPRDLGARAGTVVVSLPNPPAVEAALAGDGGLLAGMGAGRPGHRREHGRPGHEPAHARPRGGARHRLPRRAGERRGADERRRGRRP